MSWTTSLQSLWVSYNHWLFDPIRPHNTYATLITYNLCICKAQEVHRTSHAKMQSSEQLTSYKDYKGYMGLNRGDIGFYWDL